MGGDRSTLRKFSCENIQILYDLNQEPSCCYTPVLTTGLIRTLNEDEPFDMCTFAALLCKSTMSGSWT